MDISHVCKIYLDSIDEECEIAVYAPEYDKNFPRFHLLNSDGEELTSIAIYEPIYCSGGIKLSYKDKEILENKMNDFDETFLEINKEIPIWEVIRGLWNQNYTDRDLSYFNIGTKPDYRDLH